VLSAVNYSDPLQAESHQRLGDALLAAKQSPEAVREYRALLTLNTLDKAPAYLGMARALRMLGDNTASKRNVLQALEIAPHFKPAQALLLEIDGE